MAQSQSQTASGTIAGYFEDHSDAERALNALRDAGFTSAHLGVAQRGGSSNLSATSSSVANAASNTAHNVGEKTEGVWDKIVNFFEGDSVEPYADEHTRGDFASHEITAGSEDDSRYNAQHSDLHHSLTNLSVPDDRARYLGHRFGSNESGAVVTVNAQGRESQAEAILTEYGADLGHDTADYEYTGPTGEGRNEGSQNIQLLGEVLRVHKERVNQGDVRIRKEVVTENQTVQVPVTREELVIERHAVDGSSPVSGKIGENSEIRVPLTEERASFEKDTVVREEVNVGKKRVQESRDVTGEVRHEELIVDDERKTGTR